MNINDKETLVIKIEKLKSELSKKDEIIRVLKEAVEFYSHEKVRRGFELTGVTQGHRFDHYCSACNEENKGKRARQALLKIKDMGYRDE